MTNSGISEEKFIDITKNDEEIKINDLKNKIKPKYYIILLSSEENLSKCKEHTIAGFPYTDNGVWAYLDINEGDYVSFYYNGKIHNLYKVSKKFIPDEYKNKKKECKGKDKYDPISLEKNNKIRWRAISKKKDEYIYFPYRLKLLELKEGIEFRTLSIFKEEFKRFGNNILPRTGLKKSHIQLSISDIKKIFGKEIFDIDKEYRNLDLNFKDFYEVLSFLKNKNNNKITIEDIHNEKILQTLIKRILEGSKDKVFQYLKIENKEVEFFSEQTVDGGEADIVIASDSNNLVFIEVKNEKILDDEGKYTNKGKQAKKQIENYKDIIDPNKEIKKIIAGKASMKEQNIIFKITNKENNFYVIEINSDLEISNLINYSSFNVK